MPKPLFKLPMHLVQEWPEVFEDIHMNTMPVAYLKSVRLEFDNGRIWEIDIQEQLGDASKDIIAGKLLDTFNEYQKEIIKIDFSIDVQRLKQDIINKTKKMF